MALIEVHHVTEVYPNSGVYRVLINYLNEADHLLIKTVGIWMVPEYVEDVTPNRGYTANGTKAPLTQDDYVKAAVNAAKAWYEKGNEVPQKYSGLSFLGASAPEYIEHYENYTHPLEIEIMNNGSSV